VSATTAILAQIEQELPTHPLITLLTLKGGGLEIVEVKVPENSAVVGRRVGDIVLPPQSLIALVIDEKGEPRVPSGDTVVQAGDEVVAVTRTENEDALRGALTAPTAYGPYGPIDAQKR
jgi:trk system potassium uptake protein TrkA